MKCLATIVISLAGLIASNAQASNSCTPSYEFLESFPEAARIHSACGTIPYRSLEDGTKGIILTEAAPIPVTLSRTPNMILFANKHYVAYKADRDIMIYDTATQTERKIGEAPNGQTISCSSGADFLYTESESFYFSKNQKRPLQLTFSIQQDAEFENGFFVSSEPVDGKYLIVHAESGRQFKVIDPWSDTLIQDAVFNPEEKRLYLYDSLEKKWSTLTTDNFENIHFYDSLSKTLIVSSFYRGKDRVQNGRALVMQTYYNAINNRREASFDLEFHAQKLDLTSGKWENLTLLGNYIYLDFVDSEHVVAIDKKLKKHLFKKAHFIDDKLSARNFDSLKIASLDTDEHPQNLPGTPWYLIRDFTKGSSRLLNSSTKREWNFDTNQIHLKTTSLDLNTLVAGINDFNILISKNSDKITEIGFGRTQGMAGNAYYFSTPAYEKIRLRHNCTRAESPFSFDREFNTSIDQSVSNTLLQKCDKAYSSFLASSIQALGLDETFTGRDLANSLASRYRRGEKLESTDLELLRLLFVIDKPAAKSIIASYSLGRPLAEVAKDQKGPQCAGISTDLEDLLEEDIKILKKLKNSSDNKITLIEIEYLPLFSNVFQAMDKKSKAITLELFAESLRDAAIETQLLSQVFHSKLYYFAKQTVESLFGRKNKAISDIVAVPSGSNMLTPIVLRSCLPTDSPGKFTYGICYETQKPLDTSSWQKGDKHEFDFQWSVLNEEWSGRISLEDKGSLADLVPVMESFNYEEIKADGQWTGMIAISTNAGDSLAERIRKGYITHLEKIGFKFEPSHTVYNLSGFMKNRIENGEVDYLIKEAHSDGDDQNIARFGRSAKLYLAKRVDEKGILHKIYLLEPFKPQFSKVTSELVSNHDFAEWIQSREQRNLTPLIYFNLSCASFTKAINEITAAASTHLIPISTWGSRYFFVNSKKDSLKHLLDSFWKEESFQQMRDKMNAHDTYYAKGEDQFLFPDSQEYNDWIRSSLNRSLDIRTEVRDSKGRVVQVDEQFH